MQLQHVYKLQRRTVWEQPRRRRISTTRISVESKSSTDSQAAVVFNVQFFDAIIEFLVLII